MESTTLIPYSVHLKRDIHAKLKEAAGNRKAASLVRDAITSYIEGGSMYDSGYRAGLRDAMSMVSKDEAANSIALNGKTIAIGLVIKIQNMFPALKAKNGNKKTAR